MKITIQQVNEILSTIKVPYIIAGSIARGLPPTNDIDIIVERKYKNQLVRELRRNFKNVKTKIDGVKHSIFILQNKIQLDIYWYQKPQMLGTLMCYCIGDKNFTIGLRTYLRNKGLKLTQDYVEYKGKKYQFSSEEQLFDFLNLRYIPPSQRNFNNTNMAIQFIRKLKISDSIPNPKYVK